MRTVTYIILAIMAIVFFTSLNHYDINNDLLNYQLRTMYHANMEHLVANAISFFFLSSIENIIGSGQFLIAIAFIWILSGLMLYFVHWVFPSRKVYTVGFSGVVFGLFVVYFYLLSKSPLASVAGLVISILPQLFVRGISFEGHLTGIIAGIIYVLIFRPSGPKIASD